MQNRTDRFYYGWVLYGFVIIFGLGNGAKLPMIATITGELFPGNAMGRIMSMQAVGFGLGGAVGAFVGGAFHDRTGNYLIPFLMILASILCSVSLIWNSRHSRQKGLPV